MIVSCNYLPPIPDLVGMESLLFISALFAAAPAPKLATGLIPLSAAAPKPAPRPG